jgi:DNA-binding transcriptional LysR family regulator
VHLGAVVNWREAAAMQLCLLTPEMHNRSIVDTAFRQAGLEVKPAIETNSIVTMVLSVLDGEVCAVLPGALMALVRGYKGLEALPLRDPEVRTPIGFMVAKGARPSRALEAALTLANDGAWLCHAAALGGLLSV